ncbi:hypothetical protein [Streptomyces sp. NPDC002265]|uniref:effector-associated constant component EACC1 n=1 Tax=unclassified Streptomyces TaxID=2593676 RepID=UPI0033245695
MSELIIRFDGDDQEVADLVRSLGQWLHDTERLARADIEAVPRPAQPGRLGGMEEFLRLVTENPQVFTAVLTAVGHWMSQWYTTRPFSVVVNCPNGEVITGTVRSQGDVSALMERLRRDCKPCEGTG